MREFTGALVLHQILAEQFEPGGMPRVTRIMFWELSVRLETVTVALRAADGGATVQLYYEPERKSQAASQLLVATGG